MSAPERTPPMSDTITGAPSLGVEPSTEALKLARMNGGATGELIERMAWTLDPEAFEIWECEYRRGVGPTWNQIPVVGRREAARKSATALASGPVAQAVAAAREEGRVVGLGEAADWLAPSRARPCDCERCDCGNVGDLAEVAAWDAENDLSRAIRALIAPPTPAQTDTAPGGRADG